MNASDLARLEIAKRVFRATEPSAAEVQAGVRRARLALRRPRERRRWFSKGLVMVVLAVGSLAYAKPQPLGELVSSVLGAFDTPKPGLGRGAGALEPKQTTKPARAEARSGAEHDEVTRAAERPETGTAPVQSSGMPAATDAALVPVAAKPSRARPTLPQRRDVATDPPNASAPASPAVSDWGRVGQALAQGDESRALSVLAQLSESADQSTRDKADLGRAQLFSSHGNHDHACDIARALARRPVGGSIARQVQVLLKSCKR